MRTNPLSESVFLLTVSIVLAMGVCFLESPPAMRQAVLLVDGLCCEYRAECAASELADVPGVLHAEPSVSDRSIQITFSGERPVSRSALRAATARAALRPIKLSIDGATIAFE